MPRTRPPVVRKEFNPREAVEIEPETDWPIIYDLPWDEIELIVLEAVERRGTYLLEDSDVEAYNHDRARSFAARLNNMFRSHNLDYRFTSAYVKDNYWGPNKLLKSL